jgi:renalase
MWLKMEAVEGRSRMFDPFSHSSSDPVWDVVVVGAGLAGLVCAQSLRMRGYSVVVVEKSRGLGGRLATRRLPTGWADHGVRGLEVQGELTQVLIPVLCEQQILHPWNDKYVSSTGITEVAKFLATGLSILRSQRVERIGAGQNWTLTFESGQTVAARAIVLAIPAPQAFALVEGLDLSQGFLAALGSITYDACITAIATYQISDEIPGFLEKPGIWSREFGTEEGAIDWISLEQTKYAEASHPVVVVQSGAAFAAEHLEAVDLQPVGRDLLARALPFLPSLGEPDLVQVHRWRYAFVQQPFAAPFLRSGSLICAGDGLGEAGGGVAVTGVAVAGVEQALRSGLAAADEIMGVPHPVSGAQSLRELLHYLYPHL